jgi:hypothetical protein
LRIEDNISNDIKVDLGDMLVSDSKDIEEKEDNEIKDL